MGRRRRAPRSRRFCPRSCASGTSRWRGGDAASGGSGGARRPRFASRRGDLGPSMCGAPGGGPEGTGRRREAREDQARPVPANDRHVVGAILGLCRCRNFERHNGRKRKKKAGLPLVVCCKHLIAAEEANEDAGGAGKSRARRPDPGPSPPEAVRQPLRIIEARKPAPT